MPAPTYVAGQPYSARIRRSRTATHVGVSHAMLSVLVTHRARDPPLCTVVQSGFIAVIVAHNRSFWYLNLQCLNGWPVRRLLARDSPDRALESRVWPGARPLWLTMPGSVPSPHGL